jgi:hypothetical protein
MDRFAELGFTPKRPERQPTPFDDWGCTPAVRSNLALVRSKLALVRSKIALVRSKLDLVRTNDRSRES